MVSVTVFVLALMPPCGLPPPTCVLPSTTHLSLTPTLPLKSHAVGLLGLLSHPHSQIFTSAVMGLFLNQSAGRWRMILDLSSPDGHSDNNGIPQTLFSVKYVTVDSFIDGIMPRFRGPLLAKFDVAIAYRDIAIVIFWIAHFWE